MSPSSTDARAAVIVVGGGPAGLTTALALAHASPGLADRIVVLEKDRYPRDKICAGGVGARADVLLAGIGVRIDVPSVPVHGVRVTTGEGEIVVRRPWIGRVVRRIEFDDALARVARARGIRVIDGARAASIVFGRDGVEVTTPSGVFRGEAVVGADGVGSVVRRSMGIARGRYLARAVEVDTEPVKGDASRDLLAIDLSDARFPGYAWCFPTVVRGVPLVCRGAYALSVRGRPADPYEQLGRTLAARGLDLGRYPIRRFAERGFDTKTPLARPRVLLVGEAAGVDPLTGEGIAQAIAHGRMAGDYLADKLREGDLGFRDFSERWRATTTGFDLSLRARLADRFFGPRRGAFERFLVGTPAFVAATLELFSGRRVSRWGLFGSALRLAWHLAREGM
jgi:menaquinone-9 beta-reductase